MMKKVILTALMLLVSVSAFAAEISPTVSWINNNRVIYWETVTETDTTGDVFWQGGKGIMFVSGTQATADFELNWGVYTGNLSDIDGDDAPDGVHFDSASGLAHIPLFELPPGYMGVRFLSAGSGTQDLDIYLVPVK